jgi:hypothetical protein
MKKYDVRIKLFAIDNRREGKTWGEVRRAIRANFAIDPPTVRAMQKWEKELGREGLIRAVAQKTREEAEAAKREAVNRLIEGLIPRLLEAKDAGEEIEYASWRWFFSVVESTLGSDKFRAFIDKYRSETKAIGGKAEERRNQE